MSKTINIDIGDSILVGPEGPQGIQGIQGPEGKSAYEVAVENGFIGTEEEWLASLKAAIDDSKTATDTTWSSIKIDANIRKNLEGNLVDYIGTFEELQSDSDINTSKIYRINNTSDATYNNHFIYYNGTSWIDGGVYKRLFIENNSLSIYKFDEQLRNIFESEQVIIKGSIIKNPSSLRQEGFNGKVMRIKNPKKNIFGLRVFIQSDPTTIYVGIRSADTPVPIGVYYLNSNQNFFDRIYNYTLSENEIGKVTEIYIPFNEEVSYNTETLYIGIWGQTGNYGHLLAANQSDMFNLEDLIITDEIRNFFVYKNENGYYINTSWATDNASVVAFNFVTENYLVDGNKIDDKRNLVDLKEIDLNGTVKAIPKELLQDGYKGKIMRIKNPKKTIYGVKYITKKYPSTIYIGILNGDSPIKSGIHYLSETDIFLEKGSVNVTETTENITELYIPFNNPISIDSENIYIAIWGWDGNRSMLNGDLEQQKIYLDENNITSVSENANYPILWHEQNQDYYINSEWSTTNNQIPAFFLSTYEYMINSKKIYEDEKKELPLEKIISGGGFTNIFNKIACIGDSLTEGAVESTEGEDIYNKQPFSYPRQLERTLNNNVFNMGHSGATTSGWLTYAEGENFLSNSDYKCQAYIIALGTNDIGYNGSFNGDTNTDIDLSDYNNNANTSVGNYAKIIQKIKEFQPRARIFCCTIPNTRNTLNSRMAANNLIREIVNLFDNCYLIDLEKYGVKTYEVSDWKDKYYKGGHLNTVGYKLFSDMIASYIDYIIRQDPYEFWDVCFIGTDLK